MFITFFPLIHKPTRITKTTATLIDNILTNSFVKSIILVVMLTDISDHFPVFQVFMNSLQVQSKYTFQYCKFNQQNEDYFKTSLAQESCDEVFGQQDAETAYQIFINKFSSLVNESFPYVQSIKKQKKISKPWFMLALQKSSIQISKISYIKNLLLVLHLSIFHFRKHKK